MTSGVVAVRPGQARSDWSEPRADSRDSRIQTSLDVPQRTKTCHKRVTIALSWREALIVTRFDSLTSMNP
ncbi:hypothetical protein GCM10023198_58640 [Promicromonospora umidemergens]|uniref:Uncharacterized protein n=1 Tax=Promicromonospora umidemergens TaxID=629679 RepID=A0ABP8YBA7_9MICO